MLPHLTESEGVLVRRLAEQGVTAPRLLAAFARVPRRRFVPEALRGAADDDRALEIGFQQTISQPYVVARMTEALELRGDERVLEVGTGSGYQAAILAELLPSPNKLYSIEIVPELLARAGVILLELGYSHVALREGDGARGWPEAAPFDAIVVTAAPPEVPQDLLDQLALGGRLVVPVGPASGDQELELWRRVGRKEFERERLFAVRFVPLVGQGGGGLH